MFALRFRAGLRVRGRNLCEQQEGGEERAVEVGRSVGEPVGVPRTAAVAVVTAVRMRMLHTITSMAFAIFICSRTLQPTARNAAVGLRRGRVPGPRDGVQTSTAIGLRKHRIPSDLRS
jgi:hypothetical protein